MVCDFFRMNFHLSKDTKIYIAGHSGLIGSAFVSYFMKKTTDNYFEKNNR